MHDVLPNLNDLGSDLHVCIGGDEGTGKATLAAHLRGERGILVSEGLTDPSGCDVALIVADARKGLCGETRRDFAIAATSGAGHVILCVNERDPAGWDEAAYARLVSDFKALSARFEHTATTALPLSTTTGANVAEPSATCPWYCGPPLLELIRMRAADPQRSARPLRFAVEKVTRPDPDCRHYSGTIASGTLRRGDMVQVAVSGVKSAVARILADGEEREQAHAGETVAIVLAEHIDVGSGDLLVDPMHRPEVAEQFAARIVWLVDEPLLPGREYTLRLGRRDVTASVTTVKYRMDLDTPHHEAARTLRRGEVGACTISASAPIAVDPFAQMPQTGRFVLCERYTNEVMAAGTVDFALRRGVNVHVQMLAVSKARRAELKKQRPCVVWFTGLSGAGKSTIANLVESKLASAGQHTYILDGDNVRHGLNKDLGFTAADRVENIRRVGEVARLFVDSGLIVLCSFISPFRAERAAVRGLVGPSEFLEIFVSAPLDVCERRDPKGLYAKSRAGALPNFTGIDSPYETPEHPDLVLDTASAVADDLAESVIAMLRTRGIVAT